MSATILPSSQLDPAEVGRQTPLRSDAPVFVWTGGWRDAPQRQAQWTRRRVRGWFEGALSAEHLRGLVHDAAGALIVSDVFFQDITLVVLW